MTPKELAEKVVDKVLAWRRSEKGGDVFILNDVESILSSALEEAFARGQEKKASCVCSEYGPCGLHESLIKEAKAAAIKEQLEKCQKHVEEARAAAYEECAKIAESPYGLRMSGRGIADEIRRLKEGLK